MPIYQVTYFQGKEIYIVKAESEKDIGQVLEKAFFLVDNKTVFATRVKHNSPGIDKVVKIGG